MDRVRPISFATALTELQALLQERVEIFINASSSLCGCSIKGVLERVATFPPDNEAIDIVVAGQSVYIDPADVSVQLVGDHSPAQTLEFAIQSGLTIRVERLPSHRSADNARTVET